MSAEEEKSAITNVLTITRPTPARQQSNVTIDVLSTIEDIDSTHSLTPTHTRAEKSSSLDQEHQASAFSPFYNPNPTRYSLDAQKTESRQNINVISSSAYDTDVEACLEPRGTNASNGTAALLSKSKTRGETADSAVWPGQKALKMKKKAMKVQRNKGSLCGCMAGFSKKTRIWIKIVIALLVVGTAIGVGVGVSRAVGGGFWKNEHKVNAPIHS